MLLFALCAVLLILLPDLYIWNVFVRGGGVVWSLLYWLPSLVAILVMTIGALGYYQGGVLQLFFILILCVSLPKLVFVVVALLGRGVALLWPTAAMLGGAVGGVAAVVVMGVFVYGFIAGWKKIVVNEVAVVSAAIPKAFDGYTIVQLSDLHIGTYHSSPETVAELVDRVNRLNPDVILFTGDLVNTSPEELDPFMEVLAQLKAKDGVFSIFGNHDYCSYHHYDTPDGQEKNVEELKRREQQLGWTLLLNEHHQIKRGADSIAIIGVENDGGTHFPSFADLPRATAGLSPGSYKILMSHDPSHWRRSVLPDTDIQLTLSGHTHGMQLQIGHFSPSMWVYPEWGGLYEEAQRVLHVSLGTGSNIPFRFGAWPEIGLIQLIVPKA